MAKQKLGKVLHQVCGLRIRQTLDPAGNQDGLAIYHGKHLLERYPANAFNRAVKDAEGVCKGGHYKRNLIAKLKG